MKGLKQFILRGNVVDLAVGVMVGAAFGALVSSLVKDVLTPLIAGISHMPDFSGLSMTIGDNKVLYGSFLNSLISFLIVATTVYFAIVVPLNHFVSKMRKAPPVDPSTKKCPECLSEIPKDAKKCAHCTSSLIT